MEESLPAEHLQDLRAFRSTVPRDPPDHAVVQAAFVIYPNQSGRTESGTPIVEPSDEGSIEGRLVQLNEGSSDYTSRVVCLLNAHQVGCAPEARAFRSPIPAGSGSIVTLSIDADPGDRIDVLRLIEGDVQRPEPASGGGFAAFVERPPNTPPAADVEPRPSVLGGCDFATLVGSTEPQDSFRPPGRHDRDTPLFLLTQLCEESTDVVIQLVAIRDGFEVLDVEGDAWASPIRMMGDTFAAEVPSAIMSTTHELQFVVLLWSAPGDDPIWITHAVEFD